MFETAIEYGFNSKENFTRVFKAEHGFLPSEYKFAGNSLKLFACPKKHSRLLIIDVKQEA